MTKLIFATSLNTASCGGKVEYTLAHATVERVNAAGRFDGVEIVNRAGITMCLDKDAARGLAVVLKAMMDNGEL